MNLLPKTPPEGERPSNSRGLGLVLPPPSSLPARAPLRVCFLSCSLPIHPRSSLCFPLKLEPKPDQTHLSLWICSDTITPSHLATFARIRSPRHLPWPIFFSLLALHRLISLFDSFIDNQQTNKRTHQSTPHSFSAITLITVFSIDFSRRPSSLRSYYYSKDSFDTYTHGSTLARGLNW